MDKESRTMGTKVITDLTQLTRAEEIMRRLGPGRIVMASPHMDEILNFMATFSREILVGELRVAITGGDGENFVACIIPDYPAEFAIRASKIPQVCGDSDKEVPHEEPISTWMPDWLVHSLVRKGLHVLRRSFLRILATRTLPKWALYDFPETKGVPWSGFLDACSEYTEAQRRDLRWTDFLDAQLSAKAFYAGAVWASGNTDKNSGK